MRAPSGFQYEWNKHYMCLVLSNACHCSGSVSYIYVRRRTIYIQMVLDLHRTKPRHRFYHIKPFLVRFTKQAIKCWYDCYCVLSLNHVQHTSVLKQWVRNSLIDLFNKSLLWYSVFNVFIASAAQIDIANVIYMRCIWLHWKPHVCCCSV